MPHVPKTYAVNRLPKLEGVSQELSRVPMMRSTAGALQTPGIVSSEDRRKLFRPPHMGMQKISPWRYEISPETIFARLFDKEYKVDESTGITMVPGITRSV